MRAVGRSDPARGLLDYVAVGGRVGDEEIKAVAKDLIEGSEDATDRTYAAQVALAAKLRAAVKEISEFRSAGHMGDGRELAKEVAGEVRAKLGDHIPRSVEEIEMDPRKLAGGDRSTTVTQQLDPNHPRSLASTVRRF